jgi:hypothetical protein
VHAGRDDREQLLRHAFPARRQDGRQCRRAGDPALRRHAPHRRRHERQRARRRRVGGGRRGDPTPASERFGDQYEDQIRTRFPRIPSRRVSGYNLDELLPGGRFTWPGRCRHGRHLRSFSKPR